MVKKPGIPLLKNLTKRKSAQSKSIRLTNPAKPAEKKQGFLWDENSSEEGLEDTPAAVMVTNESASRETVVIAQAEPIAEAEKTQKRAKAVRHREHALSEVLHSVGDRIFALFALKRKKSNGHSAALEFAGSNKRLGRKGRRNRRVLVYAGAGLAVAAIALLVLLVPGGASAPVDDRTSAVVAEGTGTASVNVVQSSAATSSQIATPTPVPTTPPEPTDIPLDINELVEYFVVDADLYFNEVYSSNSYKYTEDDVRILAQVIYGEARGETTTGKIAVGNVVMNRVLCRRFGSSVKAVVTAPSQFTGYNENINPSRSCISAARQVLQNEVWVIPQDIYYFKAGGQVGVDWGGHTFYDKIGGHCFYRESYYGRMRNGGVPPALFDRTYKYAQYGCKPEDRVYRIQYMLDALGYDIEEIDSYFGKGTKEALIEFQQDHGLEDDGVAGPATVKRLIEEFGTRDYYIIFCT